MKTIIVLLIVISLTLSGCGDVPITLPNMGNMFPSINPAQPTTKSPTPTTTPQPTATTNPRNERK